MQSLPTTPSFSLKGKVALITGASKGIGLASACALAEAGADIHLIARSKETLLAIKDKINRLNNGHAESHALDINDLKSCEKLVNEIGDIDILVNSAGMNRPAKLQDISEDDYDAVMNLNVKSLLFISKYIALNLKQKNKGGSIINISSQMGHVGGPERIVYCASKHAIEGITKAMALELAPNNIRVNSICPTFIETELTKPFFENEDFKNFVESNIPLGKIGKVEDIMAAVVYLASDASGLMTGSSLMLDGGWTAK